MSNSKLEQQLAKSKKRGRLIVLVVLLVLAASYGIFRFVLFEPYRVVGPSMSPTYSNGQVVWASKNASTLQVGNVIAFKLPKNTYTNASVAIERVVAVGGNKVLIQNNNLTLYDSSHPSGYDPEPKYEPTASQNSNDVALVVPTGDVYVLGDNRADSLDSRQLGPISVKDVLGKVLFKM